MVENQQEGKSTIHKKLLLPPQKTNKEIKNVVSEKLFNIYDSTTSKNFIIVEGTFLNKQK